jgi:hypothetical protein
MEQKCIQNYGCGAQQNRLLWRAKKMQSIDVRTDFKEII